MKLACWRLLRDSYNSFVDLEVSQRDLRVERLQAHALGEENARLAQTDALTGLPNRRYFFQALEDRLARAATGDTFTVGLIDLDRFKPVNDTHGHAQGDRLLQRDFVTGGAPVDDLPTLEQSRDHLHDALISIPWEGLKLSGGDPALPVVFG